MKRLLVTLSCATIVLTVAAQSAREEIQADPSLAAGKYYAYQAPDVPEIKAPKGYKPFYISVFARHGSRYLTDQEKYDDAYSGLLKAAEQGYAAAQNNLGFCYDHGRGVEQNYTEAVKWYSSAERRGGT